ncbi:MAG TPA: hypothetical protein VIX73_22695, partial [Kofleriaceae bacterium]
MRWQIVYLLRDFVVAPHTFLKPKPRDIPAPPEIGAKVPELPGLRLARSAIVGFLRHVGCPFAEATVREMTTLAGEQRSIDFIVVTHSDDKASRRWCDSYGGGAGVQILADPDRARYAAWG